jgi:large subunit ribosomal protein L10
LPLSRARKEEIVTTMAERLRGSTAVVVSDYRGLDVSEMEALRTQLRESGATMHVIKNKLAAIAFAQAEIEAPLELLTGPSAIAVLGEEVSKPAKALLDFAKDHDDLEVRGGMLEGRVLDLGGVEMMSKLPTKEEVLTQIVGVVAGPARQLVGVLNAPLRDLVAVINAYATKEDDAA